MTFADPEKAARRLMEHARAFEPVQALQQKTGSQPHKSGVPGFIEPSQPSKVARPRSGPLWVHEIKQVRQEWLADPLLHPQRL